jgi:hypothetical protein
MPCTSWAARAGNHYAYSFPNGRHWHYTALALHGTALSGTVSLSCRVVSPCPHSGPDTALKPSDSAVPCHRARQSSGLVPCLGTKTRSPLQQIRIKRTVQKQTGNMMKLKSQRRKYKTEITKYQIKGAVQWLPH